MTLCVYMHVYLCVRVFHVCVCVCVQMLWLSREVVQTGVTGSDKLIFALLKQLPGETIINAHSIATTDGDGDVWE